MYAIRPKQSHPTSSSALFPEREEEDEFTRQVIGSDTSTNVAQIKGAFAVQRITRVAIWHKHLGHGQTEEDWTTIEADIVEDHALTPIEA